MQLHCRFHTKLARFSSTWAKIKFNPNWTPERRRLRSRSRSPRLRRSPSKSKWPTSKQSCTPSSATPSTSRLRRSRRKYNTHTGLVIPWFIKLLFIRDCYCCRISCSMKSFCSASIFWRASHSTLSRSRAIFRSTMSACSCCCSCSRAFVADYDQTE